MSEIWGGRGFVQPAVSWGKFVPCGWDRANGLASQLWPWQKAFGEGRSDKTNMGRCRRSYFRLPVEEVFFPSPPLSNSVSKSSNIALCASLRDSFQAGIGIQTDGTFHMLRPPKYELLIASSLVAEGSSRSCLFTLCDMAEYPHMQTGDVPAWLLS